ncbi:hypothetical protein B0T17DRAFT_532827 [Bombardia bombarda]|uniref:Uncharacterized protein n=1 Tax=Bombardia bombarda TaxID=252184 RepID=A0AA40C564_9PEZI|nr:hypothetical protein B0T17DRAFT_532827 [Bombardia bombarda]
MPEIIDLTGSEPDDPPDYSSEYWPIDLTDASLKREATDEATDETAAPANADAGADAGAEQMRALERTDWPIFDALYYDVNKVAEALGFAVTKRRTSNRGPDGIPRRVDLECFEAKQRNKSVATGKRALSKTTKKECLWKAKAVFFVEPINAWKFAIIYEDHCHPVINNFAPFFPVHRRLARTKDVVARILSYSKQPKNTSSDIASLIRKDFPGVQIKPRDCINIIAAEKVRVGGMLTPT